MSSVVNEDSLEYTMLPFKDGLLSAKLLFVFGALLVIYVIVRTAIAKKSMTLHRAPFAVTFAYIGIALANLLFVSVLYWYWSMPICAVLTAVFAFATYGEVKEGNNDERMGIWGLNKDIRRVRGEIFNDMSKDEQIAYRENVKPYKFNIVIFCIFAIAVPVAFMFICKYAGLGYLFTPIPV